MYCLILKRRRKKDREMRLFPVGSKQMSREKRGWIDHEEKKERQGLFQFFKQEDRPRHLCLHALEDLRHH